MGSSLEDYLIFNDVHFPYEDRQRYQLALKIGRHIQQSGKLSGIYLNGDICEFSGVSSWPQHPTDKMDFCTELAYANKKFDELMELFPDIPVTYICGNHEYRFFRYVRDIAPAIFGTIDCPKLLQFERRPRWRFVDYSPDQLVQLGGSKLYLRHEPLGGGRGNSAKVTAENALCDIAFGHTHTYQVSTHRKFGPSSVVTKAYSLGFLGDKSRHVFDYRGARESWVEGVTHVQVHRKSGDYDLQFIDLRQIPVLYRGQRFDLL